MQIDQSGEYLVEKRTAILGILRLWPVLAGQWVGFDVEWFAQGPGEWLKTLGIRDL